MSGEEKTLTDAKKETNPQRLSANKKLSEVSKSAERKT